MLERCRVLIHQAAYLTFRSSTEKWSRLREPLR